ncbi:MAG: Mut7-C RNAse domain-containing protein [Acidobacteriota bacterium]|jgi:uncharacterized protein with PIN domain
MSVPCPRCGRQYDVTLFQFGRTIHCTCGERVGLQQRLRVERDAPRFIADAMLGRLARWLRILGIDTAYEADIEDAELVRRALEEGRVILTCDRPLREEWRIEDILVLESWAVMEQLRAVVRHFGLQEHIRLFSRCSCCNALLRAASAQDAAQGAPEYVLRTSDEFQRCPSCGRVYWEGTHTERIRRTLADLLP